MTSKLIMVLTDICDLVDSWNKRAIPTEEEFLNQLKGLDTKLLPEIWRSEKELKEVEDIEKN